MVTGALFARPGICRAVAFHTEAVAMAKGQKRSNKEIKKPKQEKPKPAAPSRLGETIDRGKGKK